MSVFEETLYIETMLALGGLDITKPIKIARHMDVTRGVDVHELYDTNQFEIYQSYQEQNVFMDCDYLVSCLGIEKNQALFIGVYKVAGDPEKVDGFPNTMEVSFKGKAKVNSKYRYNLEKVKRFKELEGRLVLSWVNGRAWYQKLKPNQNKVIRINPSGYVRNFPGYLDINIPFRELQKIINEPDANEVWHTMLAAVGGVYLIVDTTNGMQYVGSASGKEGILGRWKEYAKNGHGENKKLIEVVNTHPKGAHKLSFTILQTLPRTLTKREIISEESKYKKKLGSRAYGLNLN
ncbi:GIY-YIG nuclease family protein [Priestia filamentosa]|uniref:GIY-YIG nuclease family protein n=1 Tax=Priestia filamentosa TaxID=1402861 RepID=UPI00398194C8